jgi:DNA N-6-adenine-methyltransferase (Dam)
MTNAQALTSLSKAEQVIAQAKTPEQSKAVESMAAAAKAYHKEQGDFEGLVDAARIYILARRKTTELIFPDIKRGRPLNNPDDDVRFLSDFGFTYKQWERRKKELEVGSADLDLYFDDCILKHTEPTTFGLLRFVADDLPHVARNSGESEWYTPPAYIEAAKRVMGVIDLDPASTEIANKTVGAELFYSEFDDGLNQTWSGRVWMNPPYASELVGQFCEKLSASFESGAVPEAIALVNNATETAWFCRLSQVAAAVVFPRGRVRFLDPQGNPGAPLQGQAVIYLGKQPNEFLKEFRGFGWGALVV